MPADPKTLGIELAVIDQSTTENNNEIVLTPDFEEPQGNLLFPGILTTKPEEVQAFLEKINTVGQSDPIFTQNLTTEDIDNIKTLQKNHSKNWLDLLGDPKKFFGNAAHKFFTDPNCSNRIYWTFRHEQIQQITGKVDEELGILKRLGIELTQEINKELKENLKTKLNEDLSKKIASEPTNTELQALYNNLNNEFDGKNITGIMNYINSSEILKKLFTAEELFELNSQIADPNNQDDNDPEAMYKFIHSSQILGKFIDKDKLSKFKENITITLNSIKEKFNLEDRYPELSDLVEYFKNVREMYKGVSITRVITDPPDSLNESFEIKYIPDPPNTEQTDAKQPDPITLITISYEPKIKPGDTDKEGNKPPQTLKFTIAANLNEEQTKKALLILNDQAARYQELSRNNKVEIFGFTKNPTKALELYELIIISGRVPTIKKETLEAWEAAANDEKNPNKEKFIKALEEYNQLNDELNPDNKSGLKDRLQTIRKKLLEEQAEIKRKKLLSNPPEKPLKEESQRQRKQSVNPNGQSAS